jgi:ATP-dependent Lhr-like helicase
MSASGAWQAVESSADALEDRLGELQGWIGDRAAAYQEELWSAVIRARSGLLVDHENANKTLTCGAVPLARCMLDRSALGFLALSPNRAAARALAERLNEPLMALGWPLRIELRCAELDSSLRRSRRLSPQILVTTPECLALALSTREAEQLFAQVHTLLLDDWHELASTKRGALLEANLAKLRSICPELCTWANSLPLPQPQEAMLQALGGHADGELIEAEQAHKRRTPIIETLLPWHLERFAYPEQFGTELIEALLEKLDPQRSALFLLASPTRAEYWFRALSKVVPELGEALALYHPALDAGRRETIEQAFQAGTVRWLVCAPESESGLELARAEQVCQIGVPGRIATLARRASRQAQPRPARQRILFVPEDLIEVFEAMAIRDALEHADEEALELLDAPVDVLMQHVLLCAAGSGFHAPTLFDELRSTRTFHALSKERFEQVLNTLTTGGALHAYPEFRRLERAGEHYVCANPQLVRLQRANIGVGHSGDEIELRSLSGRRLGGLDPHFVARLRRNDCFYFGGEYFELTMLREHMAYAKRCAPRRELRLPEWRWPQPEASPLLLRRLRERFDGIATLSGNVHGAADGRVGSRVLRQHRQNKRTCVELDGLSRVIAQQCAVSKWPSSKSLLLESCSSSEGEHLFFYPLAGRLVHRVLAALLLERLAHLLDSSSIQCTCNQIGVYLFSRKTVIFEDLLDPSLFDPSQVQGMLESAGLSLGDDARREHFAALARNATLVFAHRPGPHRQSAKHAIDAHKLHDVLERYQNDHPLMQQALSEHAQDHLRRPELLATMARLHSSPFDWVRLSQPSPLAFPLLLSHVRAEKSDEPLAQRLEMLRVRWGIGI